MKTVTLQELKHENQPAFEGPTYSTCHRAKESDADLILRSVRKIYKDQGARLQLDKRLHLDVRGGWYYLSVMRHGYWMQIRAKVVGK